MTQINETFFPEIIDTNKIKNLSGNKKSKNPIVEKQLLPQA